MHPPDYRGKGRPLSAPAQPVLKQCQDNGIALEQGDLATQAREHEGVTPKPRRGIKDGWQIRPLDAHGTREQLVAAEAGPLAITHATYAEINAQRLLPWEIGIMQGQATRPDQKKQAMSRWMISIGGIQAMSEQPGLINPARPLGHDHDGLGHQALEEGAASTRAGTDAT
jgi:hypothetical protein